MKTFCTHYISHIFLNFIYMLLEFIIMVIIMTILSLTYVIL